MRSGRHLTAPATHAPSPAPPNTPNRLPALYAYSPRPRLDNINRLSLCVFPRVRAQLSRQGINCPQLRLACHAHGSHECHDKHCLAPTTSVLASSPIIDRPACSVFPVSVWHYRCFFRPSQPSPLVRPLLALTDSRFASPFSAYYIPRQLSLQHPFPHPFICCSVFHSSPPAPY